MDDLEVRELRYFRAVAEERNFTRAAERLGMAQPPLSRAISQLERRLGVQLFERTTRQVNLTEAGLALLDESARALDAIASATRRVRRAGMTTPTLVVTAKPGLATDVLQRIVAVFRTLPHAPHAEIAVSGFGEQAAMVRDGRADVALLGSPADRGGLDTEPLVTEPRVAALRSGHELARRAALVCRDLDGQPMPRWPESTPAELDYWAGRDRLPATMRESADPQPGAVDPGPVVSDISQLLEVVALGQGVALIPKSIADRNVRPDVVYRPVSDASPYCIAIAWPDGSTAPWTAQFVRTAIEVTSGQDSGAPSQALIGIA